ncbi:hypothetical protein Tco_0981983 [Tanacetum coccineum]
MEAVLRWQVGAGRWRCGRWWWRGEGGWVVGAEAGGVAGWWSGVCGLWRVAVGSVVRVRRRLGQVGGGHGGRSGPWPWVGWLVAGWGEWFPVAVVALGWWRLGVVGGVGKWRVAGGEEVGRWWWGGAVVVGGGCWCGVRGGVSEGWRWGGGAGGVRRWGGGPLGWPWVGGGVPGGVVRSWVGVGRDGGWGVGVGGCRDVRGDGVRWLGWAAWEGGAGVCWGEVIMLGNGVIGILSESTNKWERRVPLTPAHCAKLLPRWTWVVNISLDMILPDRAYAFFSHTHKAQKENMPLLDKILAERASLFDYELIVGDQGKRLLAFGKFAGRAGLVDFLSGLGRRYLSLGYSTPFLSLGSSYMYPSLAAVVSVGEEIATAGLPSEICPLVFVFTGSGNVSLGAQEIFRLLLHTFVDSCRLPELFDTADHLSQSGKASRRAFQVYGCVVTSEDMVERSEPIEVFDKVDYYAHPERYRPIFHEKVAPYASVIGLEDLLHKGCPLVGICDITCDIGGSMEFVNRTTSIDSPLFRYDPAGDSYHEDVDGNGVICLAVDILPTEFAKEASQHFGDVLSDFIGNLASTKDIDDLPLHLRRACIAHGGALTNLYEYIPRMRNSQ